VLEVTQQAQCAPSQQAQQQQAAGQQWGGSGCSSSLLAARQQRYGANEMTIPVKSIATLVADEMWHPFYVFQYFSVIIWVAGDQYYVYAVCIFLITWFSIVTSALETHSNMARLAELAHYTCTVRLGWCGFSCMHACMGVRVC
jgi:cation-transporting ATPase 13A3/4/5